MPHLIRSSKFERLRKEAEELIRNQPEQPIRSSANILELIHELNIHEVELTIQNEELKRAQEEIFDISRKYQVLYDYAPCGYLSLNSRGRISSINRMGRSLLGERPRDVLDRSFYNYIHQGGGSFFEDAQAKAAITGKKQSLELLLDRKEDESIWVQADIEADRNEKGEINCWRMVLTDITDKKTVEMALRESEDRFKKLFEQAPVAYHAMDRKGHLITVNDSWINVMGYLRDEVVGRDFSDFMDPCHRPYFKKSHTVPLDDKTVSESEFILRRREGTTILVKYYEKGEMNPWSRLIEYHSVFFDISDQRAAEADKKKIQDQLNHTQKLESIGTLAGGVAHEFNNILAIMIGKSECVLEDLPPSSPLREEMADIITSGLRAKDVVGQLMTFSRQSDHEKEPLDMGSTVTGIMNLIRSSTPSNIAITKKISKDLYLVVGNKTQISQILINLCSNAKDALAETGGEIHVALETKHVNHIDIIAPPVQSGRYVVLSVRDNGCGMDGKTLDKIFEPYFTTKEFGKGTGIGLSVVYGLVKEHKAEISVTSRPGEGTEFTLYFPEYQGICETDDRPEKGFEFGNERILFVDDEPAIMNVEKQRLTYLGYQVKGFTSPIKALDIFTSDPFQFDLVITDMAMPQMTGDQLAASLLKIRPNIPIILCTGYSERISREKAIKIGISHFVFKPIEYKNFAGMIRKVLDEVKK